MFFTEPIKTLTAHCSGDVPDLLEALDVETSKGKWVAGALAYEAAYALEPSVFAPPEDGLLGWFGVYDEPISVGFDDADALLSSRTDGQIVDAKFGLLYDEYASRIDRIRDYIAAGDVYQINFTAPLRFQLEGDIVGFYKAIRERQRVPYGAFLNLGDTQVLSFSPELFFRIDKGRITTRPMKGTTQRSSTTKEDDRLAETLLNDEKNRAENLMIVDLLRNDLSKVANAGTVTVPELFNIERYETVTQMTSTVRATLKESVGLSDVFRALFPCGSVTGAPKLRAMERIRELEDGPRGIYCGAIGYADPHGNAAFSVPIRTAVLRQSEKGIADGQLGIGSGVVWDSDPCGEYNECLLKARFLTNIVG